MAESVIYNTVTEILKNLGSLVVQEIGLVSGVGNELDKLKNTVSTIGAVLVHAEQQRASNPEIEDWLQKLNDAFYEADDLLDDFSTELLRRQVMTQNKSLKQVSIFFSSSNQLKFSSKMAHDIKAFRERLDAVAEDRRKFHLTEQTIEMRAESIKREEADSYVDVESVIGRDVDKTNIVQLLLDSNVQENVSAVAIVGIGGLGKTTLAQLVYNDEEVTKYFELKMWACVADPFEVKIIAQKIIGSEAGEDEEVQNRLSSKIDRKKYLLVLDDVWNESRDKWLKLKELLKGGSRGSKILVTTRSELVANVTNAHSLYCLDGLSEEKSWSLFKQIAFKEVEELENPFRVIIGREIVQKCKGVPLAIRAIGSLLYYKDTEAEWLLFKNNDLLKIAQVENVSIFSILKLSYNYLPVELKRCFAFCSLYLKDEEICKEELIQLWIAKGLVHSVYENQQLEDAGDLYFMNLLRRSFFQDVQRDEWGEIISCKMHDLVHDLAQSVARLENSTLNSGAESVTERTRHVSFGFRVDSKWEFPTQMVKAKKLRTFILKDQVLEETVFGKIVSNYKCLRVLTLKNLHGVNTVPNCIAELKHLRYLDLSGSNIKIVPNFTTKLQNLQTLKLNGCRGLVELPRDIKKLVNLRHLELDGCWGLTGMPCGLGKLTSLLTLTRFVVDSFSGLSELQSLNNLRGKLCIRRIRQREDSSSSGYVKKLTTAAAGRMQETYYVEAKQYLKSLKLDFHWDEDDGVWLESLRPHPNLKELEIEKYGGVSFQPSSITKLKNLQTLKLSECGRLKQLPEEIKELVNLRHLELYMCDSLTGMPCGLGVLKNLQTLKLSKCGRLKQLPEEIKGLVNLRHLELDSCHELTEMPRGLGELKILQTLKLSECGWLKQLPEEIKELVNLRHLELYMCDSLTGMPCGLGQLPSLQFLSLWNMFYLEYMEDKSSSGSGSEDSVCSSSSSSGGAAPTPTFFPSLKTLQLFGLPKLKGWWRSQVEEEATTLQDHQQQHLKKLPSFPSLSQLWIQYCPNLASMPILQPCLEKLTLKNVSKKVVEEELKMTLVSPTPTPRTDTLATFSSSSNLKSLSLWSIDDLVTLTEPEELFLSLTSLQNLEIRGCPRLTSLSSVLRPLTALLSLTIGFCEELRNLTDLSDDDNGIQYLRNLTDLSIRSIPRLTSVSGVLRPLTALLSLKISDCKELDLSDDDNGMQYLRNLTDLSIEGIPKLVSLPVGLQHLTTLRTLRIDYCRNLMALPEWLGRLTSLQQLTIRGCADVLNDKCQRGTGEDWPKIAHIPNVYISKNPW